MNRTPEQMADEPFRWTVVKNRDEIEAFYKSIIPKIRDAAKACGYAIGVHGSLRRDLDLIAVPWREDHADKNELAGEIHRSACGIQRQSYEWEQKPLGRVAVSFPVCFPEWNEPNVGHIDLSVADFAGYKARDAEIRELLTSIRSCPSTTCSRCQRIIDQALKGGA